MQRVAGGIELNALYDRRSRVRAGGVILLVKGEQNAVDCPEVGILSLKSSSGKLSVSRG